MSHAETVRRIAAASVAALVLAMVVIALPASAVGRFTDDDGSIHEHSIEALAASGITRGCNPPTNDLFCPDAPVTRGQMAAFLTRALDLAPTTATFDDTSGHVFESDISALAGAGITKGCNPPTNGLFCPDAPVTRGQMAAFLTRALDLAPTIATFDDTSGHVFESDISALAGAGITKGCNPPTNDLFCPDDLLTRGEMATFLVRADVTEAPASPTTTTVQTSTSTVATTVTTSPRSTTSTSTSTPTTSSSTSSTSTSTSTTSTTSSTTTTTPPGEVTPVLGDVGDQWVTEGTTANVTMTATDANGDDLDIGGESLPTFVTVDDAGDGTAVLTISPAAGETGTYEFEVVVSDGTGRSDSEEITLTVQPDTTGHTGAWVETGGLLLIDAESRPAVPNWVLDTPPGYLGQGVLEWTVQDQHQGTPTVGIIEYPFEISQAGTYRVSARSRRDGTGSSDTHNDMFVKLDSEPWTKFFQLGGKHQTWEWRHRREVRDEEGNHVNEEWLVDLEPGSHLIRIAGRSVQFQLDRIALHLDHDAFPQDHFPESPRLASP